MDDAASPIVVIATFVLVAAGITALAVFLIVDADRDVLELQQEGQGQDARFVVQHASGLAWGDLDVHLVDPSGRDRADFLAVPTGQVEKGDAVTFKARVPGGTYLLTVFLGEDELVRLAVQV